MCMWCNSNNWVMFSVATSPRQHHFYGFLVARCCFTKLNSSLRCHVSWTLAAGTGLCGRALRSRAAVGCLVGVDLSEPWQGLGRAKMWKIPWKSNEYEWIITHLRMSQLFCLVIFQIWRIWYWWRPLKHQNKICDLYYIYIHNYIYI